MSTDRLSDEAAPEPTAPGPETTEGETAEAGTSGAEGQGAPGADASGVDAPGAPGAAGSGGAGVAGGAGAAGQGGVPTAAALAAAVRAVESGERSADSFFTARSPRAGSTGAAAGGRKNGGVPAPAAGSPERAGQGGSAGPAPETAAADRPGPSDTRSGAPGSLQNSPQAHTHPTPNGDGPNRPAPAEHAAPHPATTADLAPGLDGVRQVLTAGGAPEALAGKTAETLGERAAEALREDPWQLLSVPGVRPEQADGFARALLGPACGPDDERRAQALVGWLLEQAALAGHSALEASALRAALAQRSVPDPDEALQTAIAEGAVLVFQDAIETPGARPAADDEDEEQPVRVLLGLDRFAMAEESVADGLARLLNTFEEPSDADGVAPESDEKSADDEGDAGDDEDGGDGGDRPDAGAPEPDAESPVRPVRQPSPAQWEAAATAAPSPSAAELIRAAARSGLVAHTGAEAARAEPAALIAAARALGLRACGATHTADGRARLSQQVAEATEAFADLAAAPGAPEDAAKAAVTLSGLLAGREGPGRDADGALALDVLVVLDAPQLDLETAAMLVESLTDGTRLVLSGDPGMLWSAGPGRLFADVLAARCCPQVASRTPDFGPVGELVSGIGIGELNQVEAPGKEVVIVPARDPGEAVHRTVQLVADSVPRAIGIPAEQTQVITVGHGGAAGTRALNAALKERLNPGPGRFGGFDPGDRVAYSPAPGRIVPGTVTGADAAGLHLECAGAPVVVPRERVGADTVRHGWAITAHQAVGTRWPAAVVVLPGDAAKGLTRAWVYTAFGRAERHLSVVQGVDQALPRAVAEIPAKERTTRLRTLLQLHTVQATADALAG
ncbi:MULTISPECIES: helix-hairpin-helix domain-containing protein [Streptomyces]|uniref:Exonuclease V subunit alpha n=2 Tax=Streptomyces TaxID=1883 RepID=A0ABY3ZA34_STRRM|nr:MULTISPECIES: helix-hairpin-helix domain-containing protein [Streptomyces]UNZ07019.1 exonuclease V subunit alpha [Streptomyces rimosus subsp. rimosus]UTH98473.1 exonuclease V subunit alpha [Streptomyces rimosus subsp. rimosus]UTJ16572.1 exonuclease V subunit alpha [Streptomyces rimosus subsp. rimosus]